MECVSECWGDGQTIPHSFFTPILNLEPQHNSNEHYIIHVNECIIYIYLAKYIVNDKTSDIKLKMNQEEDFS